ncbi:MAG: hypothetical protein PWP21_352 [Thermosediminibacterales bacterium]|nr:hypothetical protein [Thermosediminibacterales bacterium]
MNNTARAQEIIIDGSNQREKDKFNMLKEQYNLDTQKDDAEIIADYIKSYMWVKIK